MAIWDFDMYETDELYHILKCIEELENYGLFSDEDMKRELQAEIDRQEAELCNCGAVYPTEDGFCDNCNLPLGVSNEDYVRFDQNSIYCPICGKEATYIETISWNRSNDREIYECGNGCKDKYTGENLRFDVCI